LRGLLLLRGLLRLLPVRLLCSLGAYLLLDLDNDGLLLLLLLKLLLPPFVGEAGKSVGGRGCSERVRLGPVGEDGDLLGLLLPTLRTFGDSIPSISKPQQTNQIDNVRAHSLMIITVITVRWSLWPHLGIRFLELLNSELDVLCN
jgi:hypothetical protein